MTLLRDHLAEPAGQCTCQAIADNSPAVIRQGIAKYWFLWWDCKAHRADNAAAHSDAVHAASQANQKCRKKTKIGHQQSRRCALNLLALTQGLLTYFA